MGSITLHITEESHRQLRCHLTNWMSHAKSWVQEEHHDFAVYWMPPHLPDLRGEPEAFFSADPSVPEDDWKRCERKLKALLSEANMATRVNISGGTVRRVPSGHELIRLAYSLTEIAPVCIMGPPGVGKTAIIEALVAKEDACYHRIIPAIYQATDILGYLLEDEDRTSVSHRIPRWAKAFISEAERDPARPLLLFIDEITGARPSTQDALCRLLWEREIEGISLPPHLRIIMAGNPLTDARGGHELHSALANRLLWLHIDADITAWAAGLRSWGRGDDWPAVEPLDTARWSDLLPLWSENVADFALSSPGSIQGEEKTTGAWASGRSWTLAAQAAALCQHLAFEPSLGVEASVGTACAAEFSAYLQTRELPSAEEILRNPTDCPLPLRGDALLRMCETLARGLHPVTAGRWEAYWRFFDRLFATDHRDIACTLVSGLKDVTDHDWDRLPTFLGPATRQSILSLHSEEGVLF